MYAFLSGCMCLCVYWCLGLIKSSKVDSPKQCSQFMKILAVMSYSFKCQVNNSPDIWSYSSYDMMCSVIHYHVMTRGQFRLLAMVINYNQGVI